MAELELRHVTVVRGGDAILSDVSLVVDDGALVGVIGRSGSGKSTLLRIVAGLDRVSSGSVLLDGIDVTRDAPRLRDVSMVFQDPALVPRWDVRRNVAFPLVVRHQPRDEVQQRVDAEVRAMHIESLLQRPARELSSGELQLVQIARAMVRVPRVLLLDEPLARLDPMQRNRTRNDLVVLQSGYGVTTLFTTNDPIEAMSMSDRLVVLEDGVITQAAAPLEVYGDPATLAAARLTGELNELDVRVEPDQGGAWLVHAGFRYRVWRPALAAHAGRTLVMAVRPTWVEPVTDGSVEAHIRRVVHTGATVHVMCVVAGHDVTVSVPAHVGAEEYSPGDRVGLRFDQYLLFDSVTGRRLV